MKVGVLEPKMERLEMLIPLFQKMFDECFDLDESAITHKSDLSEAQQQFRKDLIETYDSSTKGMHSPVCVGLADGSINMLGYTGVVMWHD
jgi:hypothetical protein